MGWDIFQQHIPLQPLYLFLSLSLSLFNLSICQRGNNVIILYEAASWRRKRERMCVFNLITLLACSEKSLTSYIKGMRVFFYVYYFIFTYLIYFLIFSLQLNNLTFNIVLLYFSFFKLYFFYFNLFHFSSLY